MIRRILHAELSDLRALAGDVRKRITSALERNVYLDVTRDAAVLFVGRRQCAEYGIGYVLDDVDPETWPDGARLLTIGRVTLAAWGGRPS